MCERLKPPTTIGGRRKQKVDLTPPDWSQPDLSTIFFPGPADLPDAPSPLGSSSPKIRGNLQICYCDPQYVISPEHLHPSITWVARASNLYLDYTQAKTGPQGMRSRPGAHVPLSNSNLV
jgi:hypothetical protein